MITRIFRIHSLGMILIPVLPLVSVCYLWTGDDATTTPSTVGPYLLLSTFVFTASVFIAYPLI